MIQNILIIFYQILAATVLPSRSPLRLAVRFLPPGCFCRRLSQQHIQALFDLLELQMGLGVQRLEALLKSRVRVFKLLAASSAPQ